MLTLKNTKAELLEGYQQAINRPAATWGDVATLTAQALTAIRREVPLFVKDCYRLGQWLRQGCTMIIKEMSRPVFK